MAAKKKVIERSADASQTRPIMSPRAEPRVGTRERSSRSDEAAVRQLQLQIRDVEEFRSRIVAIERGDELKCRVRCRWKDEAETGRPGPYAPDLDDGVKVNIHPFQEAGLLAVREVIKKW